MLNTSLTGSRLIMYQDVEVINEQHRLIQMC